LFEVGSKVFWYGEDPPFPASLAVWCGSGCFLQLSLDVCGGRFLVPRLGFCEGAVVVRCDGGVTEVFLCEVEKVAGVVLSSGSA
jgi:hypothetical protein